jgi:hypothetical protein
MEVRRPRGDNDEENGDDGNETYEDSFDHDFMWLGLAFLWFAGMSICIRPIGSIAFREGASGFLGGNPWIAAKFSGAQLRRRDEMLDNT